MATSITQLSATPYNIVYQIDGNDGTPATIDWATQMASGAQNGPLKALLTALNATNQLGMLNLNQGLSGKVRMRWVTGIDAAQTLPAIFKIYWAANGLYVLLGAATTLYVEVRFIHAIDR